jgi:hypothetical protein
MRVMKVICIANSGDKLSPRHFSVGYTPSSIFHLDLGKEYSVYGISLWRGLLAYLIEGLGERPVWQPSELFRVADSKLPTGWHFAFFGQNDEPWLNAVWGYGELMDLQHYDQLAELEQSALKIFEMRKKEIEEACSNI